MTMQKARNIPLPSPVTSETTLRTARPKNAQRALFESPIVKRAIKEAFLKLDPRVVAKNPVMFVVEVGSAVSTYFWIRSLLSEAADTLFVFRRESA